MLDSDKRLFPINPNGKEQINIKDLILEYFRYWYLFLIVIIICLGAAFLHIRYNTIPEYYAYSTLLIKSDNSSPGLSGVSAGLSGMAENLNVDKNIGNEIVILKSKNLMLRVLSELELHTSFYLEGRFKNLEVYKSELPINLLVDNLDSLGFGKSIKLRLIGNNGFILIEENNFEERISKHKFGQKIKTKYATFTVIGSSDINFTKDIIVTFQDIRILADQYREKLFIEKENESANVLTIGMVDPVPKRSTSIIDKLVEVYNKETQEDKNQVELSTIKFLDERIIYLSSELSDVEKNVEQYKQKNNLTDIGSNAQIYLQAENDYSKQLATYEVQIDILNSLEEYIKQDEPKLVPSSLNIEDPTLNGLISKFNELQLERLRMIRTIQPNSSLVLNIDDQLYNLKENILENLKNIKNSLIITFDNLQTSSKQFKSKIKGVPLIERELLEINRQQAIKQTIYLFLLQRREEAGLALAASTSSSRIIDQASYSKIPISPKKGSIYFSSLILGFLFPFLYIYTKNLLDDKINQRKDVEKLINVPLLGEIFHSDSKEKLQIKDGINSTIAETFRLVRSNLTFANIGKKNKTIIITSSKSGEGKTFFSINLGATFAISGKKVMVLGFDLRKSHSFSEIYKQGQKGITDYLVSDNISLDSITLPSKEVSGLYFISPGTTPPNPAELMMSSKVTTMFDDLRNQYDYIIIDSSPVGQVADVYNLAKFADSTIFIVRYNFTLKTQLLIIQDICQNKKFKQPMLVLNDAKQKNLLGHTYNYGYGTSNGKKTKEEKILVNRLAK